MKYSTEDKDEKRASLLVWYCLTAYNFQHEQCIFIYSYVFTQTCLKVSSHYSTALKKKRKKKEDQYKNSEYKLQVQKQTALKWQSYVFILRI